MLLLSLVAHAAPVEPDGGAPAADQEARDAGHVSALDGPDAGPSLVPPVLLADSPADYPDALRDAGLGGEVSLSITVDERGDVSDVVVDAATDEAFAREALRAALKLHFSPASVDGVPRAVVLTFSYRFEAPTLVPVAVPESARTLISGVVRERGNRRPIALATVTSDDGTTTTSDGDGRFHLEVKPGVHWLTVTAGGYHHGVFRENLGKTASLEVVYGLTPERINPFETIVRADRDRTEVGRVELRAAEIREVPGTFGDPFRVVMLLPGVSSVLSGIAYPVVRGSSPAATGYFLDGVRVPALFHVFLGPAVVHPDFIDGLDFYAGGAPVRYGRLVGGVIEGRLAKPRDQFHATAYADVLNAGAFVEVPVARTDTRITLAGRVSYTPLILSVVSPLFTNDRTRVVADFWDYQGRVDQGFLGGRAQLFAFGSSDTFGAEAADVLRQSSVQSSIFHRVDLKYRHPLGPGEALGELTFGSDDFGFSSKAPVNAPLEPDGPERYVGQQTRETSIGQGSATLKVGWAGTLSDTVSMTSGASWDRLQATFTQRLVFAPVGGMSTTSEASSPVAVGNFVGAWADVTWAATPRLSVTAGTRLDHFHLVPGINQTSLDPRISAKLELTDRVSLRAAAGEFHQPPTFLISVPVIDLAGVQYGLQDVVQTSVGVTWKVWRDLELSADAYVDPMLRTLELGMFDDEQVNFDRQTERPDSPNDFLPQAPTSRKGMAYGLDLMLRWPMQSRWFGWLTLSLQHSTRQTTYALYDANGTRSGAASGDLPYAFDQTVVANAVLSYRFDNGVSLGGTIHFNSGRPESGQIGSRTRVPGVDDSGHPAWIRLSRDQVDRLPAFFRIDLRVAKTWVYDAFTLEAWFDMLNVTVNGEVIGYTYGTDRAGNLLKSSDAIPVVVPNLGVKARY